MDLDVFLWIMNSEEGALEDFSKSTFLAERDLKFGKVQGVPMDKNNSIRILRINLVLILAVWAKIHEKWLKIGSFDDSIRIFILKWGTFFILMRRYPLYK